MDTTAAAIAPPVTVSRFVLSTGTPPAGQNPATFGQQQRNSGILAIASLGQDVFVLRDDIYGKDHDVDVYDSTTMIPRRNLSLTPPSSKSYKTHLTGIVDGSLAACDLYKCLYVVFGLNMNAYYSRPDPFSIVHRLQLDGANNVMIKWDVPGLTRITVAACNHHVIAISPASDLPSAPVSVVEYTTYGTPVHTIGLQPEFEYPLYSAIMISNGLYAVGHAKPFSGVSIVDVSANVIGSFAEYVDKNSKLTYMPPLGGTATSAMLIAVHGSGNIIAAFGNQLVVIDRSEIFARELQLDVAGELGDIVSICVDNATDSLVVAERGDHCGVLVVTNLSSAIAKSRTAS